MSTYIKDFSNSILSLHRYSKRAISIITDIGLCILCTWLAFTLRLEELILLKDFNFQSVLISIIIAIPIFWLFGIEHFSLHRFFNNFTILASTFVYGLLYF